MINLIDKRQIRVFISSTFQDMQPERDYLMNNVFPRLRKEAAERDVSLVELDLRWGITEEEAKNGYVVRLCLNEIDNSRPFFIGLLGDRYGWCPSREILSQDTILAERYPWITDDLARGASVTEIEMLYGALRNNDKELNASFFIKKDGENLETKQKYFKRAIRENTRFPVYNYETVEELGDKVEKIFSQLLDSLFPLTELTDLEKDRLAQRVFLNSHCQTYIPIEKDISNLDNFLSDNTSHLVLVGQSGLGKSALLSNWIKTHKSDNRYEIIYHFIGHSGDQGSYISILKHLINEIRDLYHLAREEEYDKPIRRREPKEILSELLFHINGKKPLLIILDGIDKLNDFGTDNPKYLNWLPKFPAGTKIILSTVFDEEIKEVFHRRKYTLLQITPLDINERRQLIVNHLYHYGKALTSAQVDRIAQDPKSKNTLVLRTLLNELIHFGIYEKLNERIDYYLAAPDIEDFFQRVIKRAEEAYGLEVVRDTLGLITISYRGLKEAEILEISGLPTMRWSSFFCAFEPHFGLRDGCISLVNAFLKKAVLKRYVTPEFVMKFRKRIIEYFTYTGDFNRDTTLSWHENTREWEELAHQYLATKENKKLHTLILRPEVFYYFYHMYHDGLKRFKEIWEQLSSDTTYHFSLNDYLTEKDTSFGYFDYMDLGYAAKNLFDDYNTALKAYNCALKKLSKHSTIEPDIYHYCCGWLHHALGSLHMTLKDFTSAEKEFKEALEIKRSLALKHTKNNRSELAHTLKSLGDLHKAQYNYDMAERAYSESLDIRRNLAYEDPGNFECDLALSLHSIARLHRITRKYSLAEKEYQETLSIYRRLVLKDPQKFDSDLSVILRNIGVLYSEIQEYYLAEENYKEALLIRWRVAETQPGKHESAIADILHKLGNTYRDTKDYTRTVKCYEEAIDIQRQIAIPTEEDKEELAFTLNDLGNLYQDTQDYVSSERVFSEALEIRRNLAMKNPDKYNSDLASTLSWLSVVQSRQHKYIQAEKGYKEALEIYKQLYKNNSDKYEVDIASSLWNIGYLNHHLNNNREAIESLSKSLDIYRHMENKSPGKYKAQIDSLINALKYLQG